MLPEHLRLLGLFLTTGTLVVAFMAFLGSLIDSWNIPTSVRWLLGLLPPLLAGLGLMWLS